VRVFQNLPLLNPRMAWRAMFKRPYRVRFIELRGVALHFVVRHDVPATTSVATQDVNGKAYERPQLQSTVSALARADWRNRHCLDTD
jgi:hypothetical protein